MKWFWCPLMSQVKHPEHSLWASDSSSMPLALSFKVGLNLKGLLFLGCKLPTSSHLSFIHSRAPALTALRLKDEGSRARECFLGCSREDSMSHI